MTKLIFNFILLAIGLVFISLIFSVIFGEKKIKGYYLGHNVKGNVIYVDIDNQMDVSYKLDKDISLSKTIIILDSLNAQVKKYNTNQ